MRAGDNLIRVHSGQQLPDGLASPDVYFTPGYGFTASLADGGEWVLLEAFDGAWQVPLILRTLADGTRDARSPYGYSGVYASPLLSSAQIQSAWSATIAGLRQLGIISVLLRHSPLVSQASALPGLATIVSGHPTILLEPVDNDSAWAGLASTCRTRIRKALKNGYTGDVRQASRADLAPDGDFRRLYEGTMKRLDALPAFFFSDDYYEALRASLGANLLIAEVRNQDGVPVSSALLMRHKHLLHYHLSGSTPDDARMGTNNLMIWIGTQFAVETGLRQFHLGGGLGQRDGLFRFKHKFGGREVEYCVSGLVIDPELYQAQVESQARESHTTTQELLTSGFFPAYRIGP